MTNAILKVLLVEDNPAEAVLLQEMIWSAAGGTVELYRVDRVESALAQLKCGGYDAVLLDLNLPDSRGLATLERIQIVAKGLPTIILTGVEDEDLAVRAIRHGAQDYLVKGTVDGRALTKAIQYSIDRKKVEEALRNSEAAYMAAKASVDTVNAMEEGVALATMDGIVHSVNPALLKMTGYSREVFDGRRAADLIHLLVDPDHVAAALAALESARHGKIPELGEIVLISSTARRVPVIPGVAFIRNDSGTPTMMVVTIQDITERKRLERQNQIVTTLLALFAKKSTRAEYLHAAIHAIRDWSGYGCVGLRIRNEQGEQPYEYNVGFSKEYPTGANSSALGRIELPSAETLFKEDCTQAGFASAAIVPVRYREVILGTVYFADENAETISRELMAFVETNLSPLIGEALHRFEIEDSLRQAGAYNRSLIEASPDPLITINESGKITDVNMATEKITGFSRSELVGADFSNYFTDPVLARTGYQRVFNEGVVRDFALDIRHKHGHTTPVLCNASVYRDEAGRVVGVFAAARDITERKKSQLALEAYQAELRSLSSRLTLAEERARRQLAIALHDTVGQTLALAKIKLGVLGPLVTELEAAKALTEIREMFDDAVRQTRSLSFELSPPILYELGLGAAIEWLAEEFARRLRLQIYFHETGEPGTISESVSVLFFQSARELLTNIAKHARATEVRISLKADHNQMFMKIVDNGKGMEGPSAGTAVVGGNSLGLFSIRERMKHIGGTFEIQSRPGCGTTAILISPIQDSAGKENSA